MKWIRSNIKGGARLALLSLFLQLALSFGHAHALAAPSASTPQPASELSRATVMDAGDLAAGGQATQKQAPRKHDSNQRGPDGCAVCAVMAMAGTALFSSPPILLLPEAIELLYRATDAEFIHLKSARVAFQPRAPPAS